MKLSIRDCLHTYAGKLQIYSMNEGTGMERNIDITALDTMPIDDLAELPATVLADLQDDAGNALALARKRVAILGHALDKRYGPPAQMKRYEQGKDAGIVRIKDGDCTVIAEAKKDVKWDQEKLSKLYDLIKESEDPDVYMIKQTTLKVREASYASWPEGVRSAFEPARTVKTGTPSYRIERKQAEAA